MDLVLLVLIGFSLTSASYISEPRPKRGAELSDRNIGALQILEKYGYSPESHNVITEDGYILALHRIPKGPGCSGESKGPVILQHGLFSSSVDWFLIGVERGLAYILADSCYDVWMPNSRGNKFSKAHVSLDVKSPAFWNFSWNEMGVYDTPAVVDFILNKTKTENLVYIGHSQGTTQFLVFASSKPEYSSKIKNAFLLAPIAFLSHCKSLTMQIISRFETSIGMAAQAFGVREFFPQNELTSKLGGAFCANTQPVTPAICQNLLFLICGFDSQQLNDTLLQIILGHTPAGASVKQLQHFAQNLNSGYFRQFNYGPAGNQKYYGQPTPPDYELNKITIPISLFYSHNDWLADIVDVETLYHRLTSSTVTKILNGYKKFNHVDYLYATDVIPFLYDNLLERLDAITSGSNVESLE